MPSPTSSPRGHAAAVLVVAALSSCRSDRSPPADGSVAGRPAPAAAPTVPPTVLAYTATDYHFEGPAEAPAGPTVFRLANRGAEPHHLVVLRLEQGRTYDSLLAALRKPGAPPAWVRALGGPNAAAAGGESNAERVLDPGHYAIICFIPTVEGVPHLAKGMVSPLEVSPAPARASAAPDPDPDVVIRLSDYDFELSAELAPGDRVLSVENDGPQLHELVLARLAPGRAPEELVRWELGGRKGQAPGTYQGGVAPIGPGERARFNASLQSGEYALICFVPDAKDGKPHTAHGMVKRIRVG